MCARKEKGKHAARKNGCENFIASISNKNKAKAMADSSEAGFTTTVVVEKSKTSLPALLVGFVLLGIASHYMWTLIGFYPTNMKEYDWFYYPPVTGDNKVYKTVGGATYGKKFCYTAFLADQRDIVTFWIMRILFERRSTELTRSAYRFIRLYLWPYRLFEDTSTRTQIGFITPKQLCASALLYPNEGISDVDAWWNVKSNRRRTNPGSTASGCTQACTGYLTVGGKWAGVCSRDQTRFLDKKAHSGALTSYFRKGTKSDRKQRDGTYEYDFELYPASNADTSGWMAVIDDWLNVSADGEDWRLDAQNGFWAFGAMTDGSTAPIWNNAEHNTDRESKKFSNWYTGRKDNFFGRLGIGPMTTCIIDFFQNKYASGGVQNDIAAFRNLVGNPITGNGGWVSYLQGHGNISTDDLFNDLWADKDLTGLGPKAPTCTHLSAGKVVGAVGSGATSGGMMAGMGFLADAKVYPDAGWVGGLVGVAVAGLSIYSGLSGSCEVK
jgi:hypothetical protein